MYLLSFVIWQINADRDRLHVQAASAYASIRAHPHPTKRNP